MPLDGSGVASKPAGTTAIANETIESSPFNSVIDDIYAIFNLARPVGKGGTNATNEYEAVRNLKIGRYVTKSANYTALISDMGAFFRYSAAATHALTAAATLASGWWCMVLADGGDVTVDPNSSEQINGATTITVSDGTAAIISCDGSAFYAAVIGSPAASQTQAGVVEKATDAEVRAATSNKFVSADLIESASAEVTLTDAATIAVDWDTFINGVVTLGGNRTLGNPTNGQPGTVRILRLVQDGTGSRTLAFGDQYTFEQKVAPTLTTAAGAEDEIHIRCLNATEFRVYSTHNWGAP